MLNSQAENKKTKESNECVYICTISGCQYKGNHEQMKKHFIQSHARAKCPHCNTLFSLNYLSTHVRRYHPGKQMPSIPTNIEHPKAQPFDKYQVEKVEKSKKYIGQLKEEALIDAISDLVDIENSLNYMRRYWKNVKSTNKTSMSCFM